MGTAAGEGWSSTLTQIYTLHASIPARPSLSHSPHIPSHNPLTSSHNPHTPFHNLLVAASTWKLTAPLTSYHTPSHTSSHTSPHPYTFSHPLTTQVYPLTRPLSRRFDLEADSSPGMDPALLQVSPLACTPFFNSLRIHHLTYPLYYIHSRPWHGPRPVTGGSTSLYTLQQPLYYIL